MAIVCERFDNLGRANPEQSFRLGILGGTFDPIHVGHLACAEQAREAFGLDGVIFIPTAQPVFKRDRFVTPAAHRFAMCKLATQNNPLFDVSSVEIERGGDTYTIDTLNVLRNHYPTNVELFFIAGADAISTITHWKDSESLASLARFVGVTRPGFQFIPSEDEANRLQRYHFRVDYLEVTALAISSSDIRYRVQNNNSVRYLVPDDVNDYLLSHGLYRNNKELSNG